jgi:hypothetical protein
MLGGQFVAHAVGLPLPCVCFFGHPSGRGGEELLAALKARFEKNMNRHKGLEWACH